MDRIPQKVDPRFFDKAVLPIQNALADAFSWLDYSIGLVELLTDVKGGKQFKSANLYLSDGSYEQIMPCEELGNFSFMYLRDPQVVMEKNKTLVKSPISLIIWYNLNSVSLPNDDRNREQIKGQIMEVLTSSHLSGFNVEKIYEHPKNVFTDFSYDHTENQFLMHPYTGLRIDGTIIAKIECNA